MQNPELKILSDKFRLSLKFSAKKAVEFINRPSVKDSIAKMNRKQMLKGEDADGDDLGEYGIWRTEQREERGLQTDFIDLKFEGNFHESIYAEGELRGVITPVINIETTSPQDWKAIRQDERFKGALGLQQQNKDIIAMQIANYIRDELLNYYSK